MTNTLTADKLSVGYEKKAVISGITFSAAPGQLICLLGPNGAGKSTVLRTLAGLLAPVEGTVLLRGTMLHKLRKKEIAKTLSVVMTEQPAPAMTTVYALVAMGRTPYTDFLGRLSEEDRKQVDTALADTGTAHLRERLFDTLSDGQKQKVMIARALVQAPQLMLLDEPTSHLDIRHKVEVMQVLQRLTNEKKITCVLSLHDIDLALKCCQTVMLVKGGRVVALGTPEQVVKDDAIAQLYDLRGAAFHTLLGATELCGKPGNDIFVVGGGGTGIPVLRGLSRLGIGLTAGVLHENDIDFAVASALCSTVAGECPFQPIGAAAMQLAEKLLQEASLVVDSGFPVGEGNRANLMLLEDARRLGKPVLSMRSPAEAKQLFDKAMDMQFAAQLDELLSAARDFLFRNTKTEGNEFI